MKINGRQVKLPSPVECKIFRDEEESFSFLCGPIVDYKEFDSKVPEPKAPLITNVKTGQKTVSTDDVKYKVKMAEYSELRIAWMVIKSLSATPGLEWETVDPSNPDTWLNYNKDLSSVLTQPEINRLISSVFEANNPTQTRRKEALENFTSTGDQERNTASQTLAQ